MATEKDGVSTEEEGVAALRDGGSAASDGKKEERVSLEDSSTPGGEGKVEGGEVGPASGRGEGKVEKDGASTASLGADEPPGVTMEQLDAALEDSSTFLLVGRDQATASGGGGLAVPTVEEVPAEEIALAIPAPVA